MKKAFVFVVCGVSEHIETLHTALRYLRRFSTLPAFVVTDLKRNNAIIHHELVINYPTPSWMTHHQASIWLKTRLQKILPMRDARYCYLDSDVVAVRDGVDSIFDQMVAPISFASDHFHMRRFSRWAVRCSCNEASVPVEAPQTEGEAPRIAVPDCDHLAEAIEAKFGMSITDRHFVQWNGGVFVFDERSVPFLNRWHEYSCQIMVDPGWWVRDQGALIATVWSFELQHHPRLHREYNYIADFFNPHLRCEQSGVFRHDESGTLYQPYFVHAFHQFGNVEWHIWRYIDSLLNTPSSNSFNQRVEA